MGSLLIEATLQTLYMVLVSTAISVMMGIAWGWALFSLGKRKGIFYGIVSSLTNVGRSFPFAILMIALIPFTRWILGTSLGTTAAIVPLSIAAAPFMARLTEGAFKEVNPALVEAVTLMGASSWQIFKKVLWRESLPTQIRSITMTAINLTGYSAMAGLIGGGGLGQVALQYGYQRFNTPVLLATVFLLLILVECFQNIGNFFAKKALCE